MVDSVVVPLEFFAYYDMLKSLQVDQDFQQDKTHLAEVFPFEYEKLSQPPFRAHRERKASTQEADKHRKDQ